MRLVLFDIDGTLTKTMKVDEECFVRALAEVCGFSDVDADWSHYKHATDSGIFDEIYRTRLGRPPSSNEISAFRRHFVDLLARAASVSPFESVAGARQILTRVAGSEEYRVALATGVWSDSTRLKMASAGLCYDDYPAASSDDAMDRESIMRLSIERATARHGSVDRAVYVGDGIWDARASRSLDIPFIGIAEGNRGARLMAEDAFFVAPDFNDRDLFFRRLDQIALPRTTLRVH